MASVAQLQDENRRLRSENQRLRDELDQQNNFIKSLQRQVEALQRNQLQQHQQERNGHHSGGSASTKITAPAPSKGASPYRNSSMGVSGLTIAPKDVDSGVTRREAGSTENVAPPKQSNTHALVSLDYGEGDDGRSHSLRPPSRGTVEMQQPMAPTDTRKVPNLHSPVPSLLKQDVLESGVGTQLDAVIVEEEEEEEEEDDVGNPGFDGENGDKAPKRRTLKTSKGAIKALPRELSIFNSDDDEVTKYSIDDGTLTFDVVRQDMIDAYNARGLYTGTVSKEKQVPHGQGHMSYHHAGRSYEGDWYMGHWHGHGTIKNSIGDEYTGQVVNDLKEGEGTLNYSDGRVFRGIFREDDAVKGTLIFPDGAKYVGELRNGNRHGYGVYYFTDGSRYEGNSVMSVFEGKGKMTWPDGGWYEGDWVQGEIHGFGKEVRPDGSLRHDGPWRKGVPIRK